jgi:hypothetical protein
MNALALPVAAALFATQIFFRVPEEHMLKTPKPTDVVGVVNGKDITAAELQRLLWDWEAYRGLQELIGATMIDDAAKASGIDATHEETMVKVEERIAPYRTQVQPGWTLDDHLRAVGSSYTRIYIQSRSQVLSEKLAMMDFDPAKLRMIAQIVIKPTDFSETAREQAKQTAAQVIKMSKEGHPWEVLVQRYSSDEQSKPQNGRLGWLAPEDVPEDMRQLVLAAVPGDVVGPFVVPAGVAVLKVEAAGPPPANELEAAKNIALQRGMQRLYNRLRTEMKFENKLAPPIKTGGG